MQIVLIEDDKRISDFIVKGLSENGHIVKLCTNAEDFINHHLKDDFDLLLCDIMLPGMDGMQLVQLIRFKKNYIPILMLTALNTVQDKVAALDFGADDYLTKPFHFDELLSRINALTRRQTYALKEEVSNIVQIASMVVDFDKYSVRIEDEPIELSPREFKLLKYLISNSNRAVSRIQILNAVWGISFDNQTNVVDVYISYLRNKIEKQQKFIYTIKGVGYMLKTD